MPSSRRSNFGHIRRMGRGRYRVYWEAGRDPSTGKRIQKSKVVHGTRDDAETVLAAARLESGLDGQSMTYGDLWRIVTRPSMNDDGLAERTIADYERTWTRYLSPVISSEAVSDTTPQHAESVLRGLGSPSAQRHAYVLWRKMCNQAMRRRIIDRNPIDRYIRLTREERRPKKLVDADEVPSLMQAVHGIWCEAVLLAELGGGLSPEEACALLDSDVREYADTGRKYAVISVSKAVTVVGGRKVLKGTKNGFRTREVVIGEPFAGRIIEIASSREGPFLPSRTGGLGASAYDSPAAMSRRWKKWCAEHGVKHVTQANMRSSYATMHGEAGSPDSVVAGSMGHSDGTTKGSHYQKITRRALIGIADNLTEYISSREACNKMQHLRES